MQISLDRKRETATDETFLWRWLLLAPPPVPVDGDNGARRAARRHRLTE